MLDKYHAPHEKLRYQYGPLQENVCACMFATNGRLVSIGPGRSHERGETPMFRKVRSGSVVSLACLGALTILGPAPAGAGVVAGACTVDLTFTFDVPVNLTTLGLPVDIDGGGTCQTSLDPMDPERDIEVHGSGTGIVTTCSTFEMTGIYDVSFDPPPAPPTSAGSLVLVSNVSEATMVMAQALNPTFVGVAALALDPQYAGNQTEATACLTTTAGQGMDELRYTGALVFGDP